MDEITMSSGKFEVYRDPDLPSMWRWRLRAADGQVLADGPRLYTDDTDVRAGIAAVADALETVSCGDTVNLVNAVTGEKVGEVRG